MQLGICPEAASHLQEMKDMLITISNELLDNFNDLSPVKTEKLRQDRFASTFFCIQLAIVITKCTQEMSERIFVYLHSCVLLLRYSS